MIRKLIICLCFSPAFLGAQDSPTQTIFCVKPSLGINGCQIHGDSYSGYNKLGVFAGLSVNARITEKTSLEMGFYFSQKGARHNENPKAGDYTALLINLNYIDIPLSLYYKLPRDYFVSAGLSFAYLVNYYESVNKADYTGLYHFNKFEYGLNGGIGKKLNKRLYLEVRSSNSVSPIRGYGIAATGVYYPNAIARFFNKGLYNNILSAFFTYQIGAKKTDDPKKK